MSLKVGRVTLRTPDSVDPSVPRSIATESTPTGTIRGSFVAAGLDEYRITGKNQGTGAQAIMDALVKEGKRRGSMYCEDSDTLIPAGYYELRAPEYRKPPGRPKVRPWSLELEATDEPWITRQAEDDNVAGADTADPDADEGSKVVYTATAVETAVLQARTAANAEKVNLPAGSWRFIARVQARTTTTQRFRARTTDLAGATLVSGAQVTVTAADTWTDLDLGTITVAAANDKANWVELLIQANVDLNDVWIDRLYILPA